jgi:hypothetical protein
MSLGVAEMSSNSRTAVSAELGLGLIGPEHTIVPLMASLSYDGLAGIGQKVLNIAMTSPFGHAEFEASAAAVEAFLAQTYQVVPDGTESDFMDFDAELTELLSQA